MFSTALNLFKNKNIRNRFLYTLVILFLFRLGSAITIPYVDVDLVGPFQSNSILSLVNMLGGGSLQRFSLFSLGIGPYITATIVTQLLSMDVIPYLTRLSKEGKSGQRKMERINRIITVFLAMMQSWFLTKMFDNQYNILVSKSWFAYFTVMVTLTAGTLFLLWLGDRISQFGIGNGVSLIVFAGIVANYPSMFLQMMDATFRFGAVPLWQTVAFFVSYLLIIALVVVMHLATRKIPVQYTSSGLKPTNHALTYLPLKINSASVTPVIFASSLMTAPIALIDILNFSTEGWAIWLRSVLDLEKPLSVGVGIYLFAIIILTFFYSNLQINPENISEEFSKNGSYVPGVRPGEETTKYLSGVLNRITVLGAFSLTFVAALPYVMPLFLPNFTSGFRMMGTGVIIMVGIAVETIKSLQGQLTQKNYKGLIETLK